MQIPMFLRKLAVDFVETFLGTAFAMNIAIPGDLDQAKATALLLGAGAIAALVSAARRALPAFYSWLRSALAVGEDEV